MKIRIVGAAESLINSVKGVAHRNLTAVVVAFHFKSLDSSLSEGCNFSIFLALKIRAVGKISIKNKTRHIVGPAVYNVEKQVSILLVHSLIFCPSCAVKNNI